MLGFEELWVVIKQVHKGCVEVMAVDNLEIKTMAASFCLLIEMIVAGSYFLMIEMIVARSY